MNSAHSRKARVQPKLLLVIVALLMALPGAQPCLGVDTFAAYQVIGTDTQYWSLTRDFLREKGYNVFFQLGETSLEKHLETMSRINRSPAKFLVAMEFVPGQDAVVLIAMTNRREPERGTSLEKNNAPFETTGRQPAHRFLAIEELQEKYAGESGRLADAVAGSFQVRVKHIPLFPLLGADMPGIFVRIECKRDKMGEMLGLLHAGIQNYLRRDVSHER